MIQYKQIEFKSELGSEEEFIYYVTRRGKYMNCEEVIKSLKDDR